MNEQLARDRSGARRVVEHGVLPALLYLMAFLAYTFPAAGVFTSELFADRGDGLQNYWNLWWVRKAVLELGTDPWTTAFLHHPEGVSLVGHTLNPFNGFLAIPLGSFLEPIATYNAIVLFSFVAGGCGAYALAFDVTRDRLASLVAGFLFTFSSYHFAHTEGHLQLVALEWIPVFLWAWRRVLETRTIAAALASALALFGVILCDYYYFLYCVIAGAVLLVWQVAEEPARLRALWRPLGVFTLAAAASSGWLAVRLLLLMADDPLIGAHDPSEHSLDALGLFVYGGHWRFASWTEGFWSQLPGNIHETSVHAGISVLALAAMSWWRVDARRAVARWSALALLFGGLALGPSLQIAGSDTGIPLPYRALTWLLPPLEVTGTPVRMVVMTQLSLAMLAAVAIAGRRWNTTAGRAVLASLLVIAAFEYAPRTLTTTPLVFPAYVDALAREPEAGGVVDLVAGPSERLLYQTKHERPVAFGYIARLPRSAGLRQRALAQRLRQGRLGVLCQRGLTTLVVPASPPPALVGTREIFVGPTARIHRVQCGRGSSGASPGEGARPRHRGEPRPTPPARPG